MQTYLLLGVDQPKEEVRSLREALPMHYVMHSALVLMLLAGLYFTHLGVLSGEMEDARVFKVGNKYVIKRKNLKKYAYRYQEVPPEE